MKKFIFIFIIFLFLYNSIFSIIEKNDYNDPGLVEKNGTYGLDSYMRKSYVFYWSW